MNNISRVSAALAAALVLVSLQTYGAAAMRVQYGKVTSIQATQIPAGGAPAAGTVHAGLAGLLGGPATATNEANARMNRALRSVGAAGANERVAALARSAQFLEYTVLIGETSMRVVSDQAGKRVGDCVTVEHGRYTNIRLVADDRCLTQEHRQAVGPPPAEDMKHASDCELLKHEVIAATTEERFAQAERIMRLLCGG